MMTQRSGIPRHESQEVLRAIALSYEAATQTAPEVVAKGSGLTAERIITAAREAYVPVVENAALVRALYPVPLFQEIPASLYEVVAEVLAWVYSLDQQKRVEMKKCGGSHG